MILDIRKEMINNTITIIEEGACMDFEKIVNSKIYQIFEVIYLIIITNIIWLISSGIGLFIFMIFPSSIALYLILGNQKKYEINIVKTFFRIIYKEYVKAQKVFIILGVSGLIIFYQLYFFIHITSDKNQLMIQVAFILSILSVYLYLSIWVHVIAVYVYYPRLKTLAILRNALLLSVAYPIKTFISVLIIVTTGIISYIFPALAFIFLVSLLTLIIQKLVLPIYVNLKLEQTPLDIRDYR